MFDLLKKLISTFRAYFYAASPILYSFTDLNNILELGTTTIENDYEKACRILYPFIPINGPVSVDYGIYTLQYALIFGNEILEIEKTNPYTKISLPGEISELHGECEKSNLSEYKKLLSWTFSKMKYATDQMKRAKSMINVTQVFINLDKKELFPEKTDILEASHNFLANAYKDLYEISLFLELIVNLILINKGEKFQDKPFIGLKHKGKIIQKKHGYLNKGLAIGWLNENISQSLKFILRNSYNSSIRKLAGHNNYSYDKKNHKFIIMEENIELHFNYVSGMFTNLSLLLNTLRLETLKHYYELVNKSSPSIDKISFMDWRFSHLEDEILILQYWSNFLRLQERPLPNSISFYRLPENFNLNSVCLGFDKVKHYPYDLRVIPNKNTVSLMKNLYKKNKIKITIIGVAPMVEPFTKMSEKSISLDRRILTVIGEVKTVVDIDHKNLSALITYLERQTF